MNPLGWATRRLRAVVARRALERGMQEEMRVRGGRWVHDLVADGRFAFRYFARHKATTAIIVAVLALGTGANTLIFSTFQAQFLRPAPAVPDNDAPARIWAQERPTRTARWQPRHWTHPELIALAERREIFRDVAAWTEDEVVLQGGDSTGGARPRRRRARRLSRAPGVGRPWASRNGARPFDGQNRPLPISRNLLEGNGRILVKPSVVASSLVFASCGLSAQAPVWQPSPGHTQVPIWSGVSPHAQQASGPEVVTTRVNDHLVAGRPWTYISNVSRPTLTVYSPQGENTGAAVVVFPGGGYQILAIDLEGTEVCDWLTSKGITCVLLSTACRIPGRLGTSYAVVTAIRDHPCRWKTRRGRSGSCAFTRRSGTSIHTKSEYSGFQQVGIW